MPDKISISKKERRKGEDGFKVFSIRAREETIAALDKIADTTNRSRNEIINLFLELFGSCEIVGRDYLSKVKTKIKKVNWHILPQGEMPWERLKHNLNEMLDTVKVEHKEDALNRFEFINKFAPNFVARGNGGFNDYVVFAFEDKNLFVMENAFAGNATYVFKDDWINISQLTKAQILKENLQEDRLIHKKNWKRLITEKLG